MDIYYIQKGASLELTVGNSENQAWIFQILIEFLQDLEKVSQNHCLGFVPLKITNISQSQFKVAIESPNLFVRGSLDSVVSLLNIDEFNSVFYEGNKPKIYYVEISINTLELIVENTENQNRQFQLFCECLSRSVEEIRKDTKYVHSIPLEIINILPSQFKIVIRSSQLCFGSSIASLLKNKGFNLLPNPSFLSKEIFLNKCPQRCEITFLKEIESEPVQVIPASVKSEYYDPKKPEPKSSLKTKIWQKLKLR